MRLTGTTTQGQSGPGGIGVKQLLHMSESSRTGALTSDGLVSYLGHSLAERVLSLCSKAVGVLQPQLTRLWDNVENK